MKILFVLILSLLSSANYLFAEEVKLNIHRLDNGALVCVKEARATVCGWKSLNLRYYFDESYPEEYRSEVMSALSVWQKVLPRLILTETKTARSWYTLDFFWKPLDSAEEPNPKKLARAYYPCERDEPLAGNTTMNSLSKWDSDRRFRVLVHEIGHALGLKHNEKDHSSIMYPYIINTNKYVTYEDQMSLFEVYGLIDPFSKPSGVFRP